MQIKVPVAVLGIGVEGRAVINYLVEKGVKHVTALDANDIEGLPKTVATDFGVDYNKNLQRFATIFKSPGIRPDHPELLKAKEAGTEVTSTLSYFLSKCPAKVIGVTGTVGKGTTASIVAEALRECGFTVHLGGNIGTSPLSFLNAVRPEHIVVLEISSFQAMDLALSPKIAVILKTTSEHLDWHKDTAEYRAAKANMLAMQGPNDIVVYNADSEGATEIAQRTKGKRLAFSLEREVEQGMFLRGNTFVLQIGRRRRVIPLTIDHVRLAGRFNLENIAAGVLTGIAAGGNIDNLCGACERFKGLPHRLERVVTKRGIKYYNDSYATRPEAAIAAISAFSEPLSLILGGSEKHADFSDLYTALLAHKSLLHVSLIGATAKRLLEGILAEGTPRFSYSMNESLDSAMDDCAKALPEGGVLLLAPACASFGLFPNYKVRGECFREKAKKLAGNL